MINQKKPLLVSDTSSANTEEKVSRVFDKGKYYLKINNDFEQNYNNEYSFIIKFTETSDEKEMVN